jgi:hypothetical protein
MTGGGSGRFTWASMSVVPAPSSGTPSAVTARPGEAYFTMAGKLYRSTGGAFNEVPGFTLSSIQDVHVTPMGKVLVVSNTNASLICTATDCSVGTNYMMQSSGNASDTFDGLCGRDERVFAIANGPSRQAQLFEFNGTGWMKVSNDLGFTEPRKCVVGPSGEVYVLGPTFVVRYEAGAFGQENVSLMGQGNAEWFDLSLVFTGTQVRTGMLVGGIGNLGTMTGYRYARRRAAGDGWDSLAFTPMYGDRLTSVISTGEDEFLAAGFTGGSSSTARFMEWRGSMWAPVPPANQPPAVLATVVDAVAATDREVFLVGAASSGGYAIIRGRR